MNQQCLTGGKSGGVHCTDVTNASRTMLFNIHTLDWDPELCRYFTFLDLIKSLQLHWNSTYCTYYYFFTIDCLFIDISKISSYLFIKSSFSCFFYMFLGSYITITTMRVSMLIS